MGLEKDGGDESHSKCDCGQFCECFAKEYFVILLAPEGESWASLFLFAREGESYGQSVAELPFTSGRTRGTNDVSRHKETH